MQVRKGRKPPLQWKTLWSTLKVIVICMVSLLTLCFFYLHSNSNSNSNSNSILIQQACKATRFPETCEASLTHSNPKAKTPVQIIQSAIRVSSHNLKTAQSMLHTILHSNSNPNPNPNLATALNNCLQFLDNSEYRMTLTAAALPRGRIKDGRAWMSAALAYHYDCWSALKYVKNDAQMVPKMMAFLDSLSVFTSNALSMMVSYDIYGNKIGSWSPPKTERDAFWEEGFTSGSRPGYNYKGGFPSGLRADVTVCKSGCEYGTVQEAVNAAPQKEGRFRFVIRIKQGVYQETVRVPLTNKNLVFLGDGIGKTVITASFSVAHPGFSTYNTPTLGVVGDGFMASGLTIKNTAGPNAHQAVAFRSDSDLSVIENCEFIGNQDTLYARSLRQFYKSCRIQGNMDFIFGNSASIFQDCLILVRPRQAKPEKGEKNAVTAHGRTDPAQSTGLVFQNCVVNGTNEYMGLYYSKPNVHTNFLGRPWKEYSRTIFIHCNLEALIAPLGWLPWTGDFALKTLYYGEFENFGRGANLSGRVPWSSLIPAQHVSAYSVQNFIQGDDWIPASS